MVTKPPPPPQIHHHHSHDHPIIRTDIIREEAKLCALVLLTLTLLLTILPRILLLTLLLSPPTLTLIQVREEAKLCALLPLTNPIPSPSYPLLTLSHYHLTSY